MARALLFCVGIVLGLVAEVILWNSPDLCLRTDGWHSPAFTRMVGVAVIVEGCLCAVGAGLCLGRAFVPLVAGPTRGGGGPVLPICGIFFLLAAFGIFGQAQKDSSTLAVMDSMPGQVGSEILDDSRARVWTDWTLCILWLIVGAALVASPLFLKPGVWRLGWPVNGIGCAGVGAGFLLSGMGALICFGNGMAMEGASAVVSFAGQLGILAGAIIAVVGSLVALR